MGAGGGVQVYRRTGQTCRIYKSTYAIAKRGCIRKILIRMQMCAYLNISLNSTHLALISNFFNSFFLRLLLMLCTMKYTKQRKVLCAWFIPLSMYMM